MHVPLVFLALVTSFLACTHVSLHILTMLFNKRQFFILSDVLAHIFDYPKGKDHVAVYINDVRQVSDIFDLGAVFAFGLMHAIKKNKGFAMGLWTTENIK